MNKLYLNQDTYSRLYYQYVCLNRICKISDFLTFFPEYNEVFEKCKEQFNDNVNELYKAYISRYIKRDGRYIIIKYQKHVYNLHHTIYLPSKNCVPIKKITKNIVKTYLENQNPEEFMLLKNDIKS